MKNMISFQEAQEIVKKELKKLEVKANIELGIMESETITFDFGWVFFYQSKKFIESKNEDFIVGGNAPIIVDKFNSKLLFTGTRMNEDFYIEKYCKYRGDLEQFYKEIKLI
ncbi:YrhB domain-containing protein [Flavobacterium sp. HNIBRBA15423]|uniref:YrhB domain-containing protein n=1 Tax=Flavobacterium sp. HNIBRBA15423 TaxID=3458683 RepID=UPI0040442167